MAFGKEITLNRAIGQLEETIAKTNIPPVSKRSGIDYKDFFTAYAIIRGVMDRKDAGKIDNSYDTLKSELDSSKEYMLHLEEILKTRKTTIQGNSKSFLKSKIKLLESYKQNKRRYEKNSLPNDIMSALIWATDLKGYCLILSEIGRLIKKELKQEFEKAVGEERISHNHMAEIGAIYRVFSKYRI